MFLASNHIPSNESNLMSTRQNVNLQFVDKKHASVVQARSFLRTKTVVKFRIFSFDLAGKCIILITHRNNKLHDCFSNELCAIILYLL